MKKKYYPKYPITWSEYTGGEYDSDDFAKLFRNIDKYENQEELKTMIIVIVPIAIVIVIVMLKFGG